MPSPTITDQELLAYAAGELSDEEARRVAAHLATSPADRATVERYEAARAAMRTDDSVEPSAAMVSRAKSIARPEAAGARPGWLDRLDTLVATLVFDSRLQPAAVRYQPGRSDFQLAFETDDADIDLQGTRQAEADRWMLRGQVTCDTRGEFRVSLCEPGGAIVSDTRTDERGMFDLDVSPGSYELIIELPAAGVLLKNLRIP